MDVLSAALAEGRLDQVEFADRAEAALRARFQDDIDALLVDLHADEPPAAPQDKDGRSDLIKISVFAIVSALVCLCAGMVVGDMVTGVLLWLVSLLSGGVGLLIGRSPTE